MSYTDATWLEFWGLAYLIIAGCAVLLRLAVLGVKR